MDLKGTLVDTDLRIYPSKELQNFINTIPITDETPVNIIRFIKSETETSNRQFKHSKVNEIHLNNDDIKNINIIKDIIKKIDSHSSNIKDSSQKNQESSKTCNKMENSVIKENKIGENELKKESDKKGSPFLNTYDVDWLYAHINKRRKDGEKNVPFLHVLFEGSHIELPQNEIIKRNPVLEARCVKLRAQQEAREYRKMTKSVDNVRMRFPEDSISYQMKQLNRQLIAIGQFIISIFAGFLFGFRGVEWMVGNLDFGFRLLLGVMCALVIALAEIYFLAKKLNEELNVPETVQLGGPPKFVNEPYFGYKDKTLTKKEHQD